MSKRDRLTPLSNRIAQLEVEVSALRFILEQAEVHFAKPLDLRGTSPIYPGTVTPIPDTRTCPICSHG